MWAPWAPVKLINKSSHHTHCVQGTPLGGGNRATDKERVVSRRGDGELVFAGDTVSVQEGDKFGKWMMVRVSQQCQCT